MSQSRCLKCIFLCDQSFAFQQPLKRTAMSSDDLLYYYQSVVRPVTEYACVVWHTRTDKTARVYSEACHENYIQHEQWRPTESTGHSALSGGETWMANETVFVTYVQQDKLLARTTSGKRDSYVTGKLRMQSNIWCSGLVLNDLRNQQLCMH